MNKVERINPNAELERLMPLNKTLRRQGLNNATINAIDMVILRIKREDEMAFCQKLPLAIFGLIINVLHGNGYLSKKKIEMAMNEIVTLYAEMDMALLDFDDVLGYCEKEVGMRIQLDHKELIDNQNPTFRISEMKTHQQRTADVLNEIEARLNKDIEKDAEDSDAYAQIRLINELRQRFKKEAV